MQRYISSAAALILMAGCGGEPTPLPETNTGDSATIVRSESPSQPTSPPASAAPATTAAPSSPSPTPTPSQSGSGSANPQLPGATGLAGLSEEQVFSNLAQNHSQLLDLLKNIHDEKTAKDYETPLESAIAQCEQSWRNLWAYAIVKTTTGGTINNDAISRGLRDCQGIDNELRRISKTSALPVIKPKLVRIVRMSLSTKRKGPLSERDEKAIQSRLRKAGLGE